MGHTNSDSHDLPGGCSGYKQPPGHFCFNYNILLIRYFPVYDSSHLTISSGVPSKTL